MILVNTPGDWGHVYPALLHAQWHGFTMTDAVFPCFLFIVGAAIYFSLSAHTEPGNALLYRRIAKRTLILFGIGLGLNLYNTLMLDLPNVRIMGVLQRIALCYAGTCFLVLACPGKRLYLCVPLILLVYYLFFIFAGGEHPFRFEGNIVGRIDQAMLGAQHMWRLQDQPFDPEGVVAALPAIATTLLGYLCVGRLIQSESLPQAMKALAGWGAALVMSGIAASVLMPINKNLWSVSYVLFTGGMAVLILSLCIWLADIKRITPITRPLQIYGTNPLFVYCLSWVWATTLLAIPVTTAEPVISLYGFFWRSLLPVLHPKAASLVFALAHVALFWLVALGLYRRGILIKI